MRSRSKVVDSFISGVKVYGPVHWFDEYAQIDHIDDQTVPYQRGAPLTHQKRRFAINLHGGNDDVDPSVAFHHYIPDAVKPLLGYNSPLPELFSPQECDSALLKIASNINPADGADAKAQWIAELHEGLPLMKLRADRIAAAWDQRVFLKEAYAAYGQSYLFLDFAVRQFVQDTFALFLTSYAVDEFHRNYEEKRSNGFSGGYKLGTRTEVSTLDPMLLQSNGAWVYCPAPRKHIRQTAKAFVRYSPGGNVRTIWGNMPVPPADPEKLAYGISADWKTAWNALPWSWLADWIVPVGDYLNATSTSAGYHIDEYWYGLKTVEEIVFPSFEKPSWLNVFGSQGIPKTTDFIRLQDTIPAVSRNSYDRIPREPSIIPQFPDLGLNRLGTLSALSAKLLSNLV